MNCQHRRAHSLDKQFPGCLGKMVNLFDLSAGFTSNRLLTDNPHPNGSSLSRSLSDMSTPPISPLKNQLDNKRVVSDIRRNSSSQISSGTPMKTLIEEEMSKDVETKHCPSNVIAKLMGLESLPQKHPHLSPQKSQSKVYPKRSPMHMGIGAEYWNKECLVLDKGARNELLEFHEYKDYIDFYEMLHQSNNLNTVREQPTRRGRQSRSKQEKKLALVRQKFMEAKRLVMDEKLRHTKEFQDALEVLSSNRELFLHFLQEPNSLFCKNLCELPSLPRETKRITILRPSKMLDEGKFPISGKKTEKKIKQPIFVAEQTGLDINSAERLCTYDSENIEDCPPQRTRIVVLRPSTGKNYDMRASSSPCCETPPVSNGQFHSEDAKCDEKLKSSDVTGEIPGLMQENLASDRRDETLLSSVHSNGYIGDDSSFYKSENEAIGNLSGSEVMSPPSRHSWDFVNKVGSPYSLSSFSHASYSPESSVCREAKKRLSERWALMASHQTSQEQRHVRKDSGTLGEMLALLDTKKSVRPDEGDGNRERQHIGSTSWSTSNSDKEETPGGSPKCLLRSKSVPVSSSAYCDNFNVEEADPRMGKSHAPKESAKKSGVKSSFKEKVSSLFFSRSRKSSEERSTKSQPKDKSQSAAVDTLSHSSDEPAKNSDDTSKLVNDNFLKACSSPSHNGSFNITTPEDADIQRSRGTVTNEVGLSVSKAVMPDSKESQDHPSPISVLDPAFEEDDSLTSESSGGPAPHHTLRFNVIDKSPPIGSIARTLSWNDSINEAATPFSPKSSNVSPVMEEELNWLAVVQTVLSEAGFDSQSSLDTFMSRWYSPESPLDPFLREKFANIDDKGLMPEAKRRQRRSERKLAFDCVNMAIIKVTGCGSSWSLMDGPYIEGQNWVAKVSLSIIVDRMLAQMKEWFSDEVRCVSKDYGDSNGLVVEKVVRTEVVGKGWVEHFTLEMQCLGKDIELKLFDELVDEAVADLTGRL